MSHLLFDWLMAMTHKFLAFYCDILDPGLKFIEKTKISLSGSRERSASIQSENFSTLQARRMQMTNGNGSTKNIRDPLRRNVSGFKNW